eukprot:gnl/TRDRNA2_/TRDRNA2_144620_c0_seq2.p1 gnl/TRDRNA2_/TRDRNA2_144620_c0~~gnl/TRDRNA2_/TRDRNA2_144620_c0_seq2.p1  ORF type:complete len:308 (-),score=45.89 gnl/TRDRNA2_/TRDRNA2_144620_c0_seq2:289-1092(-)
MRIAAAVLAGLSLLVCTEFLSRPRALTQSDEAIVVGEVIDHGHPHQPDLDNTTLASPGNLAIPGTTAGVARISARAPSAGPIRYGWGERQHRSSWFPQRTMYAAARGKDDEIDETEPRISRRFLGALAAIGLAEIYGVLSDIDEERNTLEVETPQKQPLTPGIAYEDIKVGGGRGISVGDYVGIKFVITKDDKVIINTTAKKKLFSFYFGKDMPGYPGLQKAVETMRRGGVRKVTFPEASKVWGGGTLRYVIEVVEVTPAYFIDEQR